MQQHPIYSFELLHQHVPDTERWQQIGAIVLHHHEHWDGNGYPARLAGTDIPYGARICAIADVWDALCSSRSYRPAWESTRVVEHLRAESGRSLDPEMVTVFLEMQGYANQ
jgi:HD-GYP domain-containing protein (c-di-GMP phosphodiesterase class II)